MRRLQVTLLGAFVLVGGLFAQAQGVSAERNKLLAKRSAEADAYRKLAEAVYGLQLNSQTYVRDFVTESDDIRTTVDSFIKGIRLGQPIWYEDGSCEISAEVTVAKVVEVLRTAHDRHYDGHDVKVSDFESISRRIDKQVIKAVGMGAPRPDLPPDLPIGAIELLGPDPIPGARPPIPKIWLELGPQGAQARLLAARAARVDAMRRLGERIMGLRLTSRTQVRDFVVESDEIMTALDTYLASSGQEVGQYFHHDELIAEVTLRVPVQKVVTMIKELHSRYYKGDDVKGHDIETITKTVVKNDIEETGMGVPPPQYLRRFAQVARMDMPDWSMEKIEARGEGTDPAIDTPQGRLKAMRAAELDAHRRLAEQIAGLQIRSETTVRDFMTEHDHIGTTVNAFIVDATVTDVTFTGDTAIVKVALPGMRVWEIISVEMRRLERH